MARKRDGPLRTVHIKNKKTSTSTFTGVHWDSRFSNYKRFSSHPSQFLGTMVFEPWDPHSSNRCSTKWDTRLGSCLWNHLTFFQVHFGADPESFHIIGHSLGAHIAGYVGERLLAIEAEGRGGGGKLGQQLLHISVLTTYLWTSIQMASN